MNYTKKFLEHSMNVLIEVQKKVFVFIKHECNAIKLFILL